MREIARKERGGYARRVKANHPDKATLSLWTRAVLGHLPDNTQPAIHNVRMYAEALTKKAACSYWGLQD